MGWFSLKSLEVLCDIGELALLCFKPYVHICLAISVESYANMKNNYLLKEFRAMKI